MRCSVKPDGSEGIADEIDRARAQEYALLATLLMRSPEAEMIERLALLRGDATPLGAAHAALGAAAARANHESVAREYFELFADPAKGVLMPYASHYLAGSLYGRPLARLRETLQQLRIERTAQQSEPEDHAAVLCEIMAGLVAGDFPAAAGADRAFFQDHLAPWIIRLFIDLEKKSGSAAFYAKVGSLGRVFMDIETKAYAFVR